MINPELRQQVEHWLAQDPDLHTVQELRELVSKAQSDTQALGELTNAFQAPLEFGTAGLRGQLGAGPNRMNRVTVIQAASGLGQYLLAQNLAGQHVVIGYDARYNSKIFAHDTARVLSAQGFVPEVFDEVVPTPVLAFAIRQLHACAGVMVTASHNPASDNGYKVYLGDGRQIVPPADTEISAHIRAVTDVRDVNMGDEGRRVSNSVMTAYVRRTSEQIISGPVAEDLRRDLTVAYTALHGVGWKTLSEVATACGFAPLLPVELQKDPDPAFPTAAFPNPEEPGALDLGITLAKQSKADVLLANDPDADRLAVALPDVHGEWVMLRGDQVGLLLAWWMITRTELAGRRLTGTMANSIVSSMMLEPLAISNGLGYQHTLTGFKWVSRVPELVYGYEEALGYCVDPDAVGDKDGISAAVMFLEMIAHLKAQSRTVWDVWHDLQSRFGVHHTGQVSVRVSDLSQVKSVMAVLRDSAPNEMGGLEITSSQDLAQPTDDLPATDAVVMHFGKADVKARVIIRPSGTEPKIKCYLEVVANGAELVSNQHLAEKTMNMLITEAHPLLLGGSS